ncbi:hypothetical protein P9239_06345 [Caballeronia sp. LZ062]|uniref:hypothetical protein n=1 Tax=unclassified Caballeronia TaxID=2646786 RepID=UPI002860F633|nr:MULTISPECIES: hypothetical protein [unclassified Caballeronia]MDR5855498.1 hypothetical protein [Caballeronia sp. LZ050]MDR5869976.1 hypothetical protein [Caballeronia sp. LZ062]
MPTVTFTPSSAPHPTTARRLVASVTPVTTAVSALLTASGNPLTPTQTSGLSGGSSSAERGRESWVSLVK